MKNLILLIGLGLSVSYSSAQHFERALQSYFNEHPNEKVFIHLDKNKYYPGETIWLKGYVLQNNLPSGLSSNFYIQLVDSSGLIIQQKHYPVAGATVTGNLEIPIDFSAGKYFVRAGTSSMLRQGKFPFTTPILVVSKYLPVNNEQAAPETIQLRFYPEGGRLIDGILSTIAVHANCDGVPIAASGIIKLYGGLEIPFTTNSHGLGKVRIRPRFGELYTAELIYKDKLLTYSLPDVQKSGVNIHIEDEKNGKFFQLTRSDADKEKFKVVSLLITLDHEVVYNNTIHFDNYPSVNGHLLTDSLPPGILYFSLFDDSTRVIAERLAFNNNISYYTPDIQILKKGSGSGEENIFRLTFPNNAPTTLSVSVTDASLNSMPKENILSFFYLRSHFNEDPYIHSLDFLNKDSAVLVDNFLLTKRWVDYIWADVLQNDNKVILPEPYLMKFSGTVEDLQEKKLVNGGKLRLFLEAEDSSTATFLLPVMSDGSFILDSMYYAGNGKFYYEYITPKGKSKPVFIHIIPNQTNQVWEKVNTKWFNGSKSHKHSKDTMELNSLIDRNNSELQHVVIETKQRRPADAVNDKYASGIFKSMGRIVIDNINEPYTPAFTGVVECIQQTVRTLKLDGQRFVNLKNYSMLDGRNWEVGAFLNETPITVSNLRSIRMDEIALIKFYETGFPAAGVTSPGGAIAIYTKNQDNAQLQAGNSAPFFNFKGYDLYKNFQPPGDTTTSIGSDKSIARTTLYWNPNVFNKPGTDYFDIRFLNNSASKTLQLIIQGIDANGKFYYRDQLIKLEQ